MLKTQRFSPDTCACVLLEIWDDATTEAERVHTFQQMEVTCAVHASQTGEAVYQAVRSENRRKNLIGVIARSIRPAFLDTEYTWVFDAQRRVVVTIANLTNAQKTALRTACDLQFAPGLVTIL
jgi:hypothetical protein